MATRKTTAPVRIPGQPPPPDAAVIAPWPVVDKYPRVLGSSVSLQTISALFRLAQTGYRTEYVDLLDELLEREPHGYAVLAQRILNVASAALEVIAAEVEDDADQKKADEIADRVNAVIRGIPDLQQSIAWLLWALYYGISGLEIAWERADGDWPWRVAALHRIHSRRIALPEPGTWRVHVWDQGMVGGWADHRGDAPTQGVFGVPVDAYPGKFIVHTAQVRGDYPTREGLGRQLAYWFALKSIGARGAAQYIERFGKPWAIAKAATQDNGVPRAANDDDIARAQAAIAALGTGSLAGAVLPDSIDPDLFGPGMKQGRIGITHDKWIELCNSEVSKVVLGQTFTTETGKFGSRSTADVGESSTLRNASYDATCLGDSLRRDLVWWIVKLNEPESIHLVPRVVSRIEDEPDANQRMDLAARAANVGMPIDADALADELGLPLVPKADGEKDKPRRLVPLALMKPADVQALEDPEALKEQQEQAAAAKQALGQGALAPMQKTNGVNGAAKPAAGDDKTGAKRPDASA